MPLSGNTGGPVAEELVDEPGPLPPAGLEVVDELELEVPPLDGVPCRLQPETVATKTTANAAEGITIRANEPTSVW